MAFRNCLVLLLSLPFLSLAAPAKRSYPNPTTRFYLRNLKTAYYTREKPVDSSWFGPVRNVLTKPADFAAYKHPRVMASPDEWDRLITQHANPEKFDKEGTWSKSFLRLTRDNGPESEFVKLLAELERSNDTNVFTGKHRSQFASDAQYDEYRKTLKPLADVLKSQPDEIKSHHLFLCAFWSQVSEKQGENGFLDKDVWKNCVDASVAWAKVLMSHRIYHCNPTCDAKQEDPERSYLWNYEEMWSVSHDWFLVGSSLALSYDVLYHKMDDTQREVIRSAIAVLVLKRWTWGLADENGVNNPNAETHPHRIFSNWATYHSNLYLTNLAIEGESGYVPYVDLLLKEHEVTGFNEKMNRKFDAVYKAFWDHSIYPDGSSFEDGYTYHTALREGALGLLVAHRRGVANVLNTDKFKNMIHHVAQQWEPKQCGHLIGHSSGGGLRYPSYVGFLRYAYPDGVLPRMVWAQRFGKDFLNTEECRIWYVQSMTQLAIFGDEHHNPYDEIADSPESLPPVWKAKFPLSYVAPRRGLIVLRGSHAQKTSYLHLDARPDSMFPGHDNADRGVITLSALKKIWLDDLDWETNIESYKHSLMHIDGIAQAKKAPSVTILKVVDTKEHVIASADLSYAYNVQWAPAWQGPNVGRGTVTDRKLDGTYFTKEYMFTDREQNSPWDLGWPMEDDAKDIGFYRGMNLNPLMDIGFAGTIEWRRHYRENPLSHFVRSTIMIRSQKNDVGVAVLVDSVDAGAGSHRFESYFILHADVTVDGSKCTDNRCKILLKNTGDERVDVHVLTRGTNLKYRLETFEGNRRMILTTSGLQSEEFWVAFHPHTGDSAGFEMARSGETMEFKYEGDTTRFSVAADHTVVEANDDTAGMDFAPGEEVHANADDEHTNDEQPTTLTPSPSPDPTMSSEPETDADQPPSPILTPVPEVQPRSDATPLQQDSTPMEPISLEPRGWQKITHEMLRSIRRSSFFSKTDAKHQIVFKIIAHTGGKYGDRLQTCRGYTNVETKIRIYDCGEGDESHQNYLKRTCELFAESGADDKCAGANGATKTDIKRELEAGRPYFVVVDILKTRGRPRFLIGHKYYWRG